MPSFLRALHRWLGLLTAVFLFVAGLTGALLAWNHELDALLAPHMYHANTHGTPQDPLALAARLEAENPELQVTYLPLSLEPDHSLQLFVQGRPDPESGALKELPFDELSLDPVTGEVQGRRLWGAFSLRAVDLLPFLYRLHYSLHLPMVGGFDTGMLLMGLIAIVWTIDSFVALIIAFPNRKTWRSSFLFRWREGGVKMIFDLHRSGGVWLWVLLVLLASTAVTMNLRSELVRPALSFVSELTPEPFTDRPVLEPPPPPGLGREQIIAKAREEAARRGWTDPPGGVFYSPSIAMYGVGFFTADNDHGDGTLGTPWLYFDARDGSPAGSAVPGTGSWGDLYLQAQFPIHSGRILGTPGRVIITVLGLAIAGLSATGVVLWARRQLHRARRASPQPGVTHGQTVAALSAGRLQEGRP